METESQTDYEHENFINYHNFMFEANPPWFQK